jgi:lipoprotein-anchoring transpeptidase ErfK/SrfK
MKADGIGTAILRGLAITALLAFTLGSVTAVVGDYVAFAYVTSGVSVAGHDLTGFTAEQVRTAVDQYVSAPALQPLTVSGGSRSWTLDPKGIVSVDADAMIAEAYAPARNATLATRLASRLGGQPLPADVKPVYEVATSTLEAWVQQTAATIDTAPVNAVRKIVRYAIAITPDVSGAKVDQVKAVDEISQTLTGEAALSTTARVANLPIQVIPAKVLKASFKRAIVVSISQRRVRLFQGDTLVKSYPCAPGQYAWPTPLGDFKIVRKQANAPWLNPHSAWSANMPDSIPGGPYNPMGDRKIGIDYPGVFLHGIPPSEYSSIGTRASHGCMRMMPSAIHDLYPRVRIGDPVFIRA